MWKMIIIVFSFLALFLALKHYESNINLSDAKTIQVVRNIV